MLVAFCTAVRGYPSEQPGGVVQPVPVSWSDAHPEPEPELVWKLGTSTGKSGLNCYDGHGAPGASAIPNASSITLDECKRRCVSSSGCEAIVIKFGGLDKARWIKPDGVPAPSPEVALHADDSISEFVSCWLRTKVYPFNCAKHQEGFELFILSDTKVEKKLDDAKQLAEQRAMEEKQIEEKNRAEEEQEEDQRRVEEEHRRAEEEHSSAEAVAKAAAEEATQTAGPASKEEIELRTAMAASNIERLTTAIAAALKSGEDEKLIREAKYKKAALQDEEQEREEEEKALAKAKSLSSISSTPPAENARIDYRHPQRRA